jgi:hypothetical protein
VDRWSGGSRRIEVPHCDSGRGSVPVIDRGDITQQPVLLALVVLRIGHKVDVIYHVVLRASKVQASQKLLPQSWLRLLLQLHQSVIHAFHQYPHCVNT